MTDRWYMDRRFTLLPVAWCALLIVACGGSDGRTDDTAVSNTPTSLATATRVAPSEPVPSLAVPSGDAEASFRAAIESTVPEDVAISEIEWGGCEADLPDPDCAVVNLLWPERAFAERAETLVLAVEERGWQRASLSEGSGGLVAVYFREGLRLFIAVKPDAQVQSCEPFPREDGKRFRTTGCWDRLQFRYLR